MQEVQLKRTGLMSRRVVTEYVAVSLGGIPSPAIGPTVGERSHVVSR